MILRMPEMINPTSKQKEVQDHDDLSLLIIAPAGCGKTETLALRAKSLLSRQIIKAPQHILMTTFSNLARDNMKDRLRRHLSPQEMRLVTVANFHGLSARIIHAHGHVIGLDPVALKMPRSDWVKEQCHKLGLYQQDINEVMTTLSSIKRQALSDEEVMAQLRGFALSIEKSRVKEGQLTYDDLPRLAELILANDQVAELYQCHFGAVIVDEFQDLTPQQLWIIQRIGYKKTTYAGDLAQGIYGFAGAEPDYIQKKLQDECESRIIKFTESFRSSPAVLEAVNSLNSLTGGQPLVAANPDSWPSGGFAAHRHFSDIQEETQYVVRFCQYIGKQLPQQRIGIAARTNFRRHFIDEAIENSELPHYRWDGAILEGSVARKIRSMLEKLSVDDFKNADDQHDFLRQAVMLDSEHDPDERRELSNAIDWCLALLEEGDSPTNIHNRIRGDETESLATRPGIHLLTGHAGKGQQFDWMVIVGLEEGCLPIFHAINEESKAKMDEEARIFAVMLSRARHGVLVTSSATVPDDHGRLRPKETSRFLNSLSSTVMSDRKEIHNWLKFADWQAITTK